MISGNLSAFAGKRVLLLQGPLGPFFRRLASDLRHAGAQVWKIDFNGGDWFFSPRGSIAYRDGLEDWAPFFERVLDDRKIDTVLLFGDCRPLHLIAHEIASARGLDIGVFEEGYVRPDYITLERFGVNGHSLIPRIPAFYLKTSQPPVPESMKVNNSFWHTALWAALYYLWSALLRIVFPHYRHHRPLTLMEAWPWMRSVWRKAYYRLKESGVQEELAGPYSGRFFLIPLQVHNDAQIHVHSDFNSVETFIDDAIASFARHAPDQMLLVIKQHPMDRGYVDRTRMIAERARKYGVQHRVRYIHDQHLPTLLKHARGVVVVNSTVGLSALHHGTPLKVCGTALYDMRGLTFQGALDDFWTQTEAAAVDRELFERFRRYLIRHTQLNGNFYRRLDLPGSCAGLLWTSHWAPHFQHP